MPASRAASPSVASKSKERSKHIEVCVRLRPLVVQKETSGSSFFHYRSKRKPAIPATTTRVSRLPGLRSSKSPPNNNKTSSPPVSESAVTTDADLLSAVYAWDVVTDDTVAQSQSTDIVPGRTHTYTLDKVYGPDSTTESVYNASVKDLVHAAMDGYHTAVLAYGQTSTGKTHTMTGTVKAPGFIPLAIRECFTRLRGNREYLLRISYLEVYKEHIRDLLATEVAPPPVRLFEKSGELQIKGLKEEVVTSPEQVFGILAQGEARRQVGATHLNQHSSRSHVMVRIWIESREQSAHTLKSNKTVQVSSLSLVDLAGSESVRLTGSSERRSEGHYINQSLMTLGQVVYALSEAEKGQKQHVPYRDSKLTRLLQPSLSGNAQVVLLCCISPLVSHIEESHNTFKFAIRAKKIPQRAVLGLQGDADEKTLLQSYREEIEDLKQQLKEAQHQREQLLLSKTFSETSTTSTITRSPSAESLSPDDADLEMRELVEAIQHMEKLILTTAPDDDEEEGDAASDQPTLPTTPTRNGEVLARTANGVTNLSLTTPQRELKREDLKSELSRIQGLLGSVLKKRRHVAAASPAAADEVRDLRAQLEQQEVATSLRQADSSFLQAQLAEKDELLAEVSKILEQVEERQEALEAENKALRQQIEVLRSEKK